MEELSRRRFVLGTGAAVTVGTLAGCTGGNGDGDGNGNGNGDGNGDDEEAGVPAEIDDYLGEANNYEGEIDDQTGEDEVTVEVGAGEGGLAFAPAAVRVDAGTTVVWEWTGEGGSHNVTSTEESDSEFESELMGDSGATFEQTFEEAGVQLYFCSPHQAQGMLGAVDVV
jgi:halocyanin-like protein